MLSGAFSIVEGVEEILQLLDNVVKILQILPGI